MKFIEDIILKILKILYSIDNPYFKMEVRFYYLITIFVKKSEVFSKF